MKNRYRRVLPAVLLMLGLLDACTKPQEIQPGEEIVAYHLPEPERVYIYQNGTVVYDAVIPDSAIINKAFILPADVENFTLSQSGKRIYSYTIEQTRAHVMLKSDGDPLLTPIQLVQVPAMQSGSPLEVKYSIRDSGLEWNLILDMEVLSDNNLTCALIAEIWTNQVLPETILSILAKKPEIILASSSNALLEDAGVFFNVDNPLIEANKRIMIALEEGETKYAIVYQWDANNYERPNAYLRAPTPLKTMAGRVQYYINSGGIIYDDDYVMVSPDRPFDIYIGQQPNIVTHKAAATAEFPKRVNLPFTHRLEYAAENQSAKPVALEISVPVTYGEKHRTEYHFQKTPDERPGDKMIWKYTLAPGEKALLQFSYDSEWKDDPSYRQFDYSDGGR